MLKLKILIAAAVILGCNGQAQAATATGTLTVQATVESACSVNSPTLNFGAYSGAQLDGTATINVTCNLLTAYSVGLDAGTKSGGSVTDRGMSDGATHTLNYSLYNDALRTTNWGNTVPTGAVTGSGLGLVAVPHIVYGRIPASQGVPTGSYTDTVQITVTF